MKYFLITNNPLVRDELGNGHELVFVDGSFADVLYEARDRCHLGHILLSHPLSGSVKPNETLYKTVMLSRKIGKTDPDSVLLIEKAIETLNKFGPIRRAWRERELKDFQLIDLTLIESAIESCHENYDQT